VTLFRPCIDLHEGRVKQIVGGTLADDPKCLETNFVADQPPEYFSRLYRGDQLKGGHVIQLGPGNEAAARAALAAWPAGLQLGGGIRPDNARQWLEAGAAKVIVTSFLFEGARLSEQRLSELSQCVAPSELVIDLSCRRRGERWYVATNRWQTLTEVAIDDELFRQLSAHCSEYLIHAADVEGLRRGIDVELVRHLGRVCPLPCTYAGGGKELADLDRVAQESQGRVDLTFGSALDIFGGSEVRYADCVAYNRRVLGGE